MNKSWRTTTLGVLAIITGVAGFLKATLDGDPATDPDMAALVAAISAGLGLVFAKDSKVTGLPGDSKDGE